MEIQKAIEDLKANEEDLLRTQQEEMEEYIVKVNN
jgi:hypothetical protein